MWVGKSKKNCSTKRQTDNDPLRVGFAIAKLGKVVKHGFSKGDGTAIEGVTDQQQVTVIGFHPSNLGWFDALYDLFHRCVAKESVSPLGFFTEGGMGAGEV